MSLSSPDVDLLVDFGEEYSYQPIDTGADEVTVTLIRSEPDTSLGQAAIKILFGSRAASGFTFEPQIDDRVYVDGAWYRVFDIRIDSAGGTNQPELDGIYLHLDEVTQ